MHGTVPDWVPPAVAQLVPHLPQVVAQRLLNDECMKGVWRYLRLVPLPHDVAGRLEKHELGLMKLVLPEDVSKNDQACAALFISVASKVGGPNRRGVWTQTQANNWAVRWENASLACRTVANEPMFAEHHTAASEMADFFDKNAKSLRERACLADLDRGSLRPTYWAAIAACAGIMLFAGSHGASALTFTEFLARIYAGWWRRSRRSPSEKK
jgi:hypothetical protein